MPTMVPLPCSALLWPYSGRKRSGRDTGMRSGRGAESRARERVVRIERERRAPALDRFRAPLERVGEQRAAAREQGGADGVALGAIAGVLEQIELGEWTARERARGERP